MKVNKNCRQNFSQKAHVLLWAIGPRQQTKENDIEKNAFI
jgi:hypothetical protein